MKTNILHSFPDSETAGLGYKKASLSGLTSALELKTWWFSKITPVLFKSIPVHNQIQTRTVGYRLADCQHRHSREVHSVPDDIQCRYLNPSTW